MRDIVLLLIKFYVDDIMSKVKDMALAPEGVRKIEWVQKVCLDGEEW